MNKIEKEMYDRITKKLGCRIEDVVLERYDYENDAYVSPFSVLNLEELDFAYDYVVKNKIKLKEIYIKSK